MGSAGRVALEATIMAAPERWNDYVGAGIAVSSEEPPAWLSIEETVAAVQAAGYAISRSLLDRWQRATLIPPRRQWHHPSRAGSQSAYPAAALPGIITLARLRKAHGRSMNNLAIAAWAEGAAIPVDTVRTSLAATLRQATMLSERAEVLRRDVTTGEVLAPFDAAEAIMTLVPDVRALRERLPAREDRTTVATLALEWWFGGAPLWSGSGGEVAVGLGEALPQALLGRQFGLDESALAGRLAITPQQVAAGLDVWHQLGIGPLPEIAATVASWADAEVHQVQRDLVAWRAVWNALAFLLPLEHGDPFAAMLLTTDTPLEAVALQACAFVAIRRTDQWGAMLDVFLALVEPLTAATTAAYSLTAEQLTACRAEVWRQIIAMPEGGHAMN